MLKSLTQAQIDALNIRLQNAKRYDGLHEEQHRDKLAVLIAKAPGGQGLDITKHGWCAHFVGATDAELGYAPYGGRAADIGKEQVEVDSRVAVPGVTVAFNGHAALLDDMPQHIFGGNQSNSVCSQHMKYYGQPLGYYIPREIAELVAEEAPAAVPQEEPLAEVNETETPPQAVNLSELSDDEILAELKKRKAVSDEPPIAFTLTEITRDDLRQALKQVVSENTTLILTDNRYRLPSETEIGEVVQSIKSDLPDTEGWTSQDYAKYFVHTLSIAGIKSAGRIIKGDAVSNIILVQGNPIAFHHFDAQEGTRISEVDTTDATIIIS